MQNDSYEWKSARASKPILSAHRVAVVAKKEAVIFLLVVGEVPAGRPLCEVVLDHVRCGDLGHAVDAHGHVLRVAHRVAVPAPVRKVQRDEDHRGVHDEAEEVGPPVNIKKF